MFGPEYPLIITKIVQYSSNEFQFEIGLVRYSSDEEYIQESLNLLRTDYSISFNLLCFSESDAYNNLSRYDKEY